MRTTEGGFEDGGVKGAAAQPHEWRERKGFRAGRRVWAVARD